MPTPRPVVVTTKRALAAANQHVSGALPQPVKDGGKATPNEKVPRLYIALAAIAAVGIAVVVITGVVHDSDYSKETVATPVTGLTIFAVFFVAASAIERLLEPLSGLMTSASAKSDDATSAVAQAGGKVAAAAGKADDSSEATKAKSALDDAAKAVAESSYTKYWKSIVLWGIATIIAMLVSAGMKLYFLRTVGIAAGPRWTEVLGTGLIIGAGTKPLHDLVGYIQAASTAKAAST